MKSSVGVLSRKPPSCDAVTGSASGLDPHISRHSRKPGRRVAKARGISVDQANQMVAVLPTGPDLGLWWRG